MKLAAVLLASVIAIAGCSRAPEFHGTDITGSSIGGDFTLTGHDGKPHSIGEYKGKAVVLFFGFTHCPDICPTTMATLSQAMKQLGPDADRVQVLFVSVDPERDTPDLLGHYVPAFDPRFVGLTGTPEQVADVAKQWRAFYQKVPGSTPDSYSVDHFAGMYVLDAEGRLRLFLRGEQPPADIAADLKKIVG
ncbi:SCO family protein [Derxia gummosa]|uniref:SCO family protein n=1 Tax=Derxia gummosa DSM 723 TaxID=1121388 RepID=A0A8B6X5P0_9BURK|nr:SCO family protein [Derxia gummosa]